MANESSANLMTPISQHWDSNLSTSIQQSIRCNCIAGANFQQGNFPTRGLKGDSFHCDPTWVHIVCVIWTSEQTIYTIDINWHEMFVWHPITCWIENVFSSGKAHYKLGRLDHSVCVYRCAFMPVTQKCWRVSKIKPLHHLFQMVSFIQPNSIQNPWVIRLLKPWTLAVLGALVRQRCYGVGIHGQVNGAPLIQQRHRPGHWGGLQIPSGNVNIAIEHGQL